MNTYLLNLSGFTPEQWVEFKGKLANKALLGWQTFCEVATFKRVRVFLMSVGAVLMLGLAVFLGSKALVFFGRARSHPQSEIPQTAETAPPKGRFEIKLEMLRKDVEDVFETNPDLLYPSVEIESKF